MVVKLINLHNMNTKLIYLFYSIALISRIISHKYLFFATILLIFPLLSILYTTLRAFSYDNNSKNLKMIITFFCFSIIKLLTFDIIKFIFDKIFFMGIPMTSISIYLFITVLHKFFVKPHHINKLFVLYNLVKYIISSFYNTMSTIEKYFTFTDYKYEDKLIKMTKDKIPDILNIFINNESNTHNRDQIFNVSQNIREPNELYDKIISSDIKKIFPTKRSFNPFNPFNRKSKKNINPYNSDVSRTVTNNKMNSSSSSDDDNEKRHDNTEIFEEQSSMKETNTNTNINDDDQKFIPDLTNDLPEFNLHNINTIFEKQDNTNINQDNTNINYEYGEKVMANIMDNMASNPVMNNFIQSIMGNISQNLSSTIENIYNDNNDLIDQEELKNLMEKEMKENFSKIFSDNFDSIIPKSPMFSPNDQIDDLD